MQAIKEGLRSGVYEILWKLMKAQWNKTDRTLYPQKKGANHPYEINNTYGFGGGRFCCNIHIIRRLFTQAWMTGDNGSG